MRKKKNIISVCIVIMIIFVIIIAVGKCVYSVKGRLNTQIQDSLVNIAQKNAVAMEKEVNSIHDMLTGIATEMEKDNLQDMLERLDYLKPYADIYQLKRMGFITPSGMAYTTDGYKRPVLDRTSLELGMQGKWHASDRIIDSLGKGEEINIFSVPVYIQGEEDVQCVLFATFSATHFNDMLEQDIFRNEGYCFIIKTDGTLIAGLDPFVRDEETGFVEALIGAAPDNKQKMKEIRQDMLAGKSGFEQIYYKEDYYTYYMPVEAVGEEDNWYLYTVVPKSLFSEHFTILWQDIQEMLNVIIVGLTIIFIIYFLLTHKQNVMLEKLAYVDPLTGGYNYAYFKERVVEKNHDTGYIVSVDIGDFRMVNNVCGEKMGDQLLLCVWDVLLSAVSENDLVAHVNADHFIFYFATESENEVIKQLDAISKEIHEVVDELNIPHVVPYYGICAWDRELGLEKNYSRANQAKNRIKSRRDASYAFYDDKVFQQTVDNRRLVDSFEHAIAAEEFEVWYQPKYDTLNSCIVGAEALVRWRKEGELIPPYRFIPLFERNGMIATLDEYVFRHVCCQQKIWQKEKKSIIPISVNISRASLFYSGIADRYEEILNEYQLEPEFVSLEITESAMLENDDINGIMEKFRNTGFRLLLDDFGNGYSSLATLNTMKFDILKLDKSLIDYIGDRNGEELLKHTVELAKYFGLNITAEGVETKEQVIFLQQIRCDDIQGYYFSKPLPEPEFEKKLA